MSSDDYNIIADVADPEWSCYTWKLSLDGNGLTIKFISAKTAFDEDVKHFDRICCHFKTDMFIQICVADKGHSLAVGSEDMIELCIPGSTIDSSDPISLASLPLFLFEQNGIDVDLSRFSFLSYSEFSDRFGDKSVWFTSKSLQKLMASFPMLSLKKETLFLGWNLFSGPV